MEKKGKVKTMTKRGKAYCVQESFRTSVKYLPGPHLHTCDTRRIQKYTLLSLCKVRHNDHDAPIDALDIDIDNPVKLTFRHLHRRLLVIRRTGIVDHHIQATKALQRQCQPLFPSLSLRDVKGEKHGGRLGVGCCWF